MSKIFTTKEIKPVATKPSAITNNDITVIKPGFENAPQALRDVLSGRNFGKQLIKI